MCASLVVDVVAVAIVDVVDSAHSHTSTIHSKHRELQIPLELPAQHTYYLNGPLFIVLNLHACKCNPYHHPYHPPSIPCTLVLYQGVFSSSMYIHPHPVNPLGPYQPSGGCKYRCNFDLSVLTRFTARTSTWRSQRVLKCGQRQGRAQSSKRKAHSRACLSTGDLIVTPRLISC